VIQIFNPTICGPLIHDWTQTYQDASSMAGKSVANGDNATIAWKRALNENGFSTTRSGNTVTFSSVGDVIGTDPTKLANGSYFNLRAPDGSYDIMVKRGATNKFLDVSVALAGWNSDGNANTAPTPAVAGDQKWMLGSGAVGGSQSFYPTDNTYTISTAVQTAAPYNWYFFTMYGPNFGSPFSVFFEAYAFVDHTLNFFVPKADPSPNIFCFGTAGNTNCAFRVIGQATGPGLLCDGITNLAGGPRAYLGKGTPNVLWSAVPVGFYTLTGAKSIPGAAGVGSGGGSDLVNAADVPLPVLYARSIGSTGGAPYGVKGFSSFMRYPSETMWNGQRVDYSGPGSLDGIVVNSVILPWPSKFDLQTVMP
jgi:hypothetical protein